jgi:hypothetical protein
MSAENIFPSIGSPDPFPLVNVWDVVRLLRPAISWPCFMVILEGLNTNFPSVLFVIVVMAEIGAASYVSNAGIWPFA